MPAEIMHFPFSSSERSMKGSDTSIDIHFVRHGAKKSDGTLRKDAISRARRLGQNIALSHDAQNGTVIVYSGTKERVKDTAAAIRDGYRQRRQVVAPVSEVFESNLLSHTTFLLDSDKSDYFRRANGRLEKAFQSPLSTRRGKIRAAEERNISEWIESDRQQIDAGTAAPWEIGRNIVQIVNNCLEQMDTQPANSHSDFIMVTHEYIVAAVIRYLLISSEGGLKNTGKDIFKKMKNIKYLEDVVLHIRSDIHGEKYIFATIRGKEYGIQLDQLVSSTNVQEIIA